MRGTSAILTAALMFGGPAGRAQESAEHPARVSGAVMAMAVLHKEAPVYPEDAKRAKITGAVVMAAIINPAGAVEKLDVVAGPEALREASLTAVRQWTYKPFLLNGAPVYVQTTVTVFFSLSE